VEREPLAGAADTRLHLVQDQQSPVPVGDLASSGEVSGGRHPDSGLTLDRFEHDGRGIHVDGIGEGARVAVRHVHDARGHRLERRTDGRLAGQGQRTHRPAVKASRGCDDLRSAGPAGHLESCLVRLGAGVGQEDPRS